MADNTHETSTPAHQTHTEQAAETAARDTLADINAVWATWTSGRIDTDDAMAAIRDHLTTAREQGALQ